MNKQAIFNRVWAHAIAQNESSSSEGRCLYRGPGGLKCFIGALIPDEAYEGRFDALQNEVPLMDLEEIVEVLEDKGVAGFEKKLNDSEDQFLLSLQSSHDNVGCDDWLLQAQENLRTVAVYYSLQVPNG